MSRRMRTLIGSITVMLLALVAVACAGGPAASPTPAVQPTPSPTSPAAPPTSTINRVCIPETGLAFEIPAGWQQQGQAWMWTTSGADGQLIGFKWAERRPGQEPEPLLLPANSVVLDRTPGPEVPWGTAATYRLEVMLPEGQGQVQAVEMHVIVLGEAKLYDFYASASDEAGLAVLEPILAQIVSSATLSP